MIHPNMATMLVFLTTDCAHQCRNAAKGAFRRCGGDIQHGQHRRRHFDQRYGHRARKRHGGQRGDHRRRTRTFDTFMQALNTVTVHLCRCIAGRRRGRDKAARVSGAAAPRINETAKTVAKSVICSSLVKAAMFGADANWGRVLCAIGYSGADVDVTKIDVTFTLSGRHPRSAKTARAVALLRRSMPKRSCWKMRSTILSRP